MSRIGKRPVVVPKEVTIKMDGEVLSVKGPKGDMSYPVAAPRYSLVKVSTSAESISVARVSESRESRTQQGLIRAIIQNMVNGAAHGFTRQLDIVGVGYKADVKGKVLGLSLGFSHPVVFPIPDGIHITVDKQTRVTITGADRQKVGEVAASIRRLRPPEPYKGKGVRYVDEYIKRKVGKAAAGTTTGG